MSNHCNLEDDELHPYSRPQSTESVPQSGILLIVVWKSDAYVSSFTCKIYLRSFVGALLYEHHTSMPYIFMSLYKKGLIVLVGVAILHHLHNLDTWLPQTRS